MPAPRTPAVFRKVSEIKPDDIRISIVGTIVDSRDSILAVDDGTGKVNVNFEDRPQTGPGQVVRVFGRVIPLEDGVELQGEICQDFSGVDMALWNRVSGLWQEYIKKF